MPETKNEITIKTSKKSMMSLQTDYISNIALGLKKIIGNMDQYQSVCGYNILNAINVELAKKGLSHQSPDVDKESINNAIKFCILYRLNTDNKEVFVIVRNEKRNDQWIKKIECKPQYKGQLKILSSFGANVKKVYPEWIVREGDDFKYATYKGVEVLPPEWTPKHTEGKVLRVVVPVEYNDGFIDYRIAERESVATNIKAQIKQSIMNAKDVDSVRIMTLIKDYNLDQLLKEKTIEPYLNETYTGLSSEEMIITKLILNATKRVIIDYQSALARELLEDTYDNADVYKKTHTAAEIIEMEQSPLEIEGGIESEVSEPAKEEKEETLRKDLIQEDDPF